LWYIREHLSPIFDGTNTCLIISIPEMLNDREVPAAWRRNIFLAIKESLHNVLKHAGATHSSLTFSIDHEKLKIVIADNGKGFDVKARLVAGNGLRNIRKRILDCGGDVQIESSRCNGTILHIEVPLNF
jgi:signal transduction histidine kinase